MREQFLIALLLCATAGTADAHDFWIEPSTYRPTVPGSVAVRLRVGEHFGRGDPYPRDPARIHTFVVAGPSALRPIGGRPGRDPAGLVKIDAPGIYVLGYRSRPVILELEAARFEDYLRKEHLERISRQRAERGQSTLPGREAFSRCAKAIVVAGKRNSTGHDRLLGFTLELVPERNPATLRPPDDLPVRLLYKGSPLPNAYVAAISAQDPMVRIEALTDALGRVHLRLDRAGAWLVRTVYMAPASEALDADWESLWASLTLWIAGHSELPAQRQPLE